jgi:hypothetical protein
MINVIAIDVDSTPVTLIVIFDWDDPKTSITGEMALPVIDKGGFLDDTGKSLLLAIPISILGNVKHAVGASITLV